MIQAIDRDLNKRGNIKDNKFHSNYWQIIFLGYYSFLIDCFHTELVGLNELITSKIEGKNLFDNIFKLFSKFNDWIFFNDIYIKGFNQ